MAEQMEGVMVSCVASGPPHVTHKVVGHRRPEGAQSFPLRDPRSGRAEGSDRHRSDRALNSPFLKQKQGPDANFTADTRTFVTAV